MSQPKSILATQQLYDLVVKRSTHEKQMERVQSFAGLELDQIPQNIDAEVHLIGALMMDDSAFPAVTQILNSGDFFYIKFGYIFDAMRWCFDKQGTFDHVSIADRLSSQITKSGDTNLNLIVMGAYTGYAALHDIMSYGDMFTFGMEIVRASLIRELSDRRAVMQAAFNAFKHALNREQSFEEVSQKAYDDMAEAIGRGLNYEDNRLQTILPKFYDNWEAKLKAFIDGTITIGLPSSIPSVDGITKGIHRKQVTYLAGLNGVGKTVLLLQALYDAAKAGGRVLLFTCEMSHEEIINRLLSLETGIPVDVISTFTFTSKDDVTRITEAVKALSKLDMIIIDKYRAQKLTPAIVKIEISYHKRGGELQLIGIDGLWLMSADGAKVGMSRHEHYTTICPKLAGLAQDFDARIWITHQINHNYLKRSSKRPIMSDMEGGMAIRNNAQVIMFIHHDDHDEVKIPTETPEKREVIISKNRNGKTGTVEVRFLPERMRFIEWFDVMDMTGLVDLGDV